MRFPRCCFGVSKHAVLEDGNTSQISAIRPQDRNSSAVPKGQSKQAKPARCLRPWPFGRRRTEKDASSRLTGSCGEVLQSQASQASKAATAAALKTSNQEKEPLMTSVEADARLASAVVPPPVSTILKTEDSPPSAAPSRLPLPEGYVLAPFCSNIRWQKKISDRKLSAGATAAVYRGDMLPDKVKEAEDGGQDQDGVAEAPPALLPVAVKAVNLDKEGNAELALHEGQVLASMGPKPYVPKYLGLYQDPESRNWHRNTYLVSELVPGMSLEELCSKVGRAANRCRDREQCLAIRRWIWDLATHVLRHLALALEDVHRERSHRDLKSGNIMLSGWDSRQALKVSIVDWAGSRLHTEEHRRNGFCTPEYSSPQLIAVITSLPAPVLNDAANDMWSLGVIAFQMLMTTIPGKEMPFEADYSHAKSGATRQDVMKQLQKSVQQQHDEWAAVSPKASSGHEDDSLQPWQLTALQDCAEFNDGNAAEAAERCRGMTAVLTGLLEVCDQRRWTAEQLAGNSWLQGAAQQAISPCPLQL